MLLKFSVKNFRNFEDWLVVDLSQKKNYEFNPEVIRNNIVNHSMVYGLNGGGKSNLGLAILDLTNHLLDNPVLHELDNNYLNANSEENLAHFKYEFSFDDNILNYDYGKESCSKVVYETLKVNGVCVAKIDRRKSPEAKFDLKGTEHLKTDLKESGISILKYLLSNTVLDSNDQNDSIIAMKDFVGKMLFFRSINLRAEAFGFGQKIGVKRLSDEIIEKEKVVDFEQFLNDSGVKCNLCIINGIDDKRIAFKFNKKTIEFNKVASTGTLSLGIFYYWWLKLLSDEVKFAYIDEFDAFYHHSLARSIVKKITELKCQTIMTTHNISIISNDLLRPDCYFELSESMHSLADMTSKDLRKAHNLEKIYKGLTL